MEVNLNQECLGVLIGAFAIGINYFFDYKSKKKEESDDNNKPNTQTPYTNCEFNQTMNPQQMNLLDPSVRSTLCETYRKNMQKEFDILLRSEMLNLKLDMQKYINEEIRRHQLMDNAYDLEKIIERYIHSKNNSK